MKALNRTFIRLTFILFLRFSFIPSMAILHVKLGDMFYKCLKTVLLQVQTITNKIKPFQTVSVLIDTI